MNTHDDDWQATVFITGIHQNPWTENHDGVFHEYMSGDHTINYHGSPLGRRDNILYLAAAYHKRVNVFCRLKNTTHFTYMGTGVIIFHTYNVFSIHEWYKCIKNDPGTYYDDPSGVNNHHPRIISNDETSIHQAIQF